GAGDERQRLHVQRLVGVAEGTLGAADDRRGRTVAHTAAVEHAELAGDQRAGSDGLLRDLLAELGTRVDGTVAVVLPRDTREHVLHLRLAHAVLVAVRRREE